MTRISTFGVQNAAVAQMMAQYAKLARTQNQLSTGSRLLTAADDPVAAGVAQALDRAVAETERYGANANFMKHRLALAESSLGNVNDRLNRLSELLIQSNNAALSPADRASMIEEVRGIRDALFAIANRADGEGRYLFGGAQDATAPFTESGTGVTYNGDQTVRLTEIANGLSVYDVHAGSEVFMRVGPGRVTSQPDPGNTGTGVLDSSGFTNPASWVSDNYTVLFSEPVPGTIEYEVLDGSNAPLAPPVTGTYVPGEAISFNGYQLSVRGQPAAGDSFNVAERPGLNVFDMVDRALVALATPNAPPSVAATRQNETYLLLGDLQATSDHIVRVRADLGTRLNLVDQSDEEREAQLLNLKSTLSGLRDLDYVEAISRLNQEASVLQAAQESFTRLQALSLFDRL